MIDRDAARALVGGATAFSAEMIRDLACSWGEGPDSEVEVLDAGTTLEALEVFDVTIVPGDLTVTGLLTDAPNDHSLLIVLGNLTVERAVISGQIFVVGDLQIGRALVCDSGGNHGLYVAGTIGGQHLVEVDHDVEAGAIEVARVFRRGADETLLDEACLDEGAPDFSAIADRVRGDAPLFRS